MSEKKHDTDPCTPFNRRELLCRAVAGGLGVTLHPVWAKDPDPRKLPPQVDDELVFPSWEREATRITPADVPHGGPPVLAYPRDPMAQLPREKSRLNQILLLRFGDEELGAETRAFAAEGVVAYSGVCTHTGCSVTEWEADARNLLCPCHASQFDPRERARIIGGPATRPLPMLPLATNDGGLIVAGPFSAKVGAKKT